MFLFCEKWTYYGREIDHYSKGSLEVTPKCLFLLKNNFRNKKIKLTRDYLLMPVDSWNIQFQTEIIEE